MHRLGRHTIVMATPALPGKQKQITDTLLDSTAWSTDERHLGTRMLPAKRAPITPSLESWLSIWENPGWGAEKWRTGQTKGGEEAAAPVLSNHSLKCLQKPWRRQCGCLLQQCQQCCITQSGGKELKKRSEGHKIVMCKVEVPVQGSEKGRTRAGFCWESVWALAGEMLWMAKQHSEF